MAGPVSSSPAIKIYWLSTPFVKSQLLRRLSICRDRLNTVIASGCFRASAKPDIVQRTMRTLVFSLAFTSLVGFALAQAPNVAGRQQFETRCAHCHGGDATGGEGGPNIIDQIDSRTPSEMAAFLRTGRPASGMPAFDLPA